MTSPEEQSQWLADLATTMRREVAAQRETIAQHWEQPLRDRVGDGRTLGPLQVIATASFPSSRATPTRFSTTGPAGCGKSLVLVIITRTPGLQELLEQAIAAAGD